MFTAREEQRNMLKCTGSEPVNRTIPPLGCDVMPPQPHILFSASGGSRARKAPNRYSPSSYGRFFPPTRADIDGTSCALTSDTAAASTTAATIDLQQSAKRVKGVDSCSTSSLALVEAPERCSSNFSAVAGVPSPHNPRPSTTAVLPLTLPERAVLQGYPTLLDVSQAQVVHSTIPSSRHTVGLEQYICWKVT